MCVRVRVSVCVCPCVHVYVCTCVHVTCDVCVCAFQSRDCLLLQFKGASEDLRIWRIVTRPLWNDRFWSCSILDLYVSMI